MPELPEVSEMVSYLDRHKIRGLVVSSIVHRNPGGRYDAFLQMERHGLYAIYRRGKYMTFHMEHGILVVHNAMSGYWDIKGSEWCFDYVEGARVSKESDVRVEFVVYVNGEAKTVRFHDARLFGHAKFYPVHSIEEILSLKKLGHEPIVAENIDPTTDVRKLYWSVADVGLFDGNHEIKRALMEQNVVAGIGNIYSSETCWRAGVAPDRKCSTLSDQEWQFVFESAQKVLLEALARKLDYSDLRVYRKKKCYCCKGPIVRTEIGKRSTYSCPKCQK